MDSDVDAYGGADMSVDGARVVVLSSTLLMEIAISLLEEEDTYGL